MVGSNIDHGAPSQVDILLPYDLALPQDFLGYICHLALIHLVPFFVVFFQAFCRLVDYARAALALVDGAVIEGKPHLRGRSIYILRTFV
jgi:hypothetical protein